MYATLPLNMTTAHGGARVGAGRKTIFPQKAIRKPFAMDFTAAGRRALATLVRRTGLSRNAVIGWLALRHGDAVSFDKADPFPQKARAVLAIRVPPPAGAKLAAARVRTGHGYSDIGEALVRWFGGDAAFPPPASGTGQRSGRAGKHPPRHPAGKGSRRPVKRSPRPI
jgi:hypothetical protein